MSVTAAKGFRAAGVVAGLKPSGSPDLALVVNDGPLDVAAGVFTTNRFTAAPVVWSRGVIAGEQGRRGAPALSFSTPARPMPAPGRGGRTTPPTRPSTLRVFWAASTPGTSWSAPPV